MENFSVSGEGRRGKGAYQLRAQVLRVALSRVRPLVLRLKGGILYYQEGAHLLPGSLLTILHRQNTANNQIRKKITHLTSDDSSCHHTDCVHS